MNRTKGGCISAASPFGLAPHDDTVWAVKGGPASFIQALRQKLDGEDSHVTGIYHGALCNTSIEINKISLKMGSKRDDPAQTPHQKIQK